MWKPTALCLGFKFQTGSYEEALQLTTEADNPLDIVVMSWLVDGFPPKLKAPDGSLAFNSEYFPDLLEKMKSTGMIIIVGSYLNNFPSKWISEDERTLFTARMKECSELFVYKNLYIFVRKQKSVFLGMETKISPRSLCGSA